MSNSFESNQHPKFEVKLWFCSLNSKLSPQQIARFEAILTPEERDKVGRFKLQKAQQQGLIVRAALRLALSQHRSIKPQDWRFEYGEKGKPRLSAQQRVASGLEFNISHSGDWLVIAICHCEQQELQLGVDIERERAHTNFQSIMKHYFTQCEIKDVMALEDESRRKRFFDLWALKESYIKARGLGLALSLQSFQFNFHRMQKVSAEVEKHASLALIDDVLIYENIMIETAIDSGQKQNYQALPCWQVLLGRLNSNYRFAVCTDKPAEEVHLTLGVLDL